MIIIKILVLLLFFNINNICFSKGTFSETNEDVIGNSSKNKFKEDKPVFKTKVKTTEIEKEALNIVKIKDNVYSVNDNIIVGLEMAIFNEETNTYQIKANNSYFKISSLDKFKYDGKKLITKNSKVSWNNIFFDVNVTDETSFFDSNGQNNISGNFAFIYEYSNNIKLCIDSTIDDKMSFSYSPERNNNKILKNTILCTGRKDDDHLIKCYGNAKVCVKFLKEKRNILIMGNSDNILFETDGLKSLNILKKVNLSSVIDKYLKKLKKENKTEINFLKNFKDKTKTKIQNIILDRKIDKINKELSSRSSNIKAPFIVYSDIRKDVIYIYLLTASSKNISNGKIDIFYHKIALKDFKKDKGFFFFYNEKKKLIAEFLNGHIFSYEKEKFSKLILPISRTILSSDELNANISGIIADISNKKLLLREGKTELVNKVEKFLNIDYKYLDNKLVEINFSTIPIDKLEFPGLGVNAETLRNFAKTFDEKLVMSLSSSVLQPAAVEMVKNTLKEMLLQYIQEYLIFPELLEGDKNYFDSFLSKIGYYHLSELIKGISLDQLMQQELMKIEKVSKIDLSIKRNTDKNFNFAKIIIVIYSMKKKKGQENPELVEIFRSVSKNIPILYKIKGKTFNIFDSIEKAIKDANNIDFTVMFDTYNKLNKFIGK